jgi:polysaccharide lyase family 4-like protein
MLMREKFSAYFGMLLISLISSASTGYAAKKFTYIEGTVDDGGAITGIVSLRGPAPLPVRVNLRKKKDAGFCIKHTGAGENGIFFLQHVETKDGKLKDVVIFIENIGKGKPWPEKAVNVDFKNCQAFPKVLVVRKPLRRENKGLLTIKNHDENILHNPKGFSIGSGTRKTLFKRFLLNKGSETDVTKQLKFFKKGRDKHFYIECEQHLWMSVSARIVWNPYYAISEKDGSFKIDRIPPGTYRVIAWHPYVGETARQVTIRSGAETHVDFELVPAVK